MRKIVFTGPECSGKSTLSTALSKKFNLPLVEEYARQYLNDLNKSYNYDDLLQIAKGQLKLEKEAEKKMSNLLICDTNLQVIKIWSELKYSKCDPFILQNQDIEAYYVLCYPDFKWKYDPLRENPNNRMQVVQKYYQELKSQNQKFIIVKGSNQDRISFLKSKISKMIE